MHLQNMMLKQLSRKNRKPGRQKVSANRPLPAVRLSIVRTMALVRFSEILEIAPSSVLVTPVRHLLLLAMHLFLLANIVTTGKALVTTSDALVSTSKHCYYQ